MRINKFNNVAGLTLIEIMLGVVISSIMMAAMYTTYNVVNNSYSQVVDRAKISRSGRDIVGMIMRDIRLAGFKYYYGTHKENEDSREDEDPYIPREDYLKYQGFEGSEGVQIKDFGVQKGYRSRIGCRWGDRCIRC